MTDKPRAYSFPEPVDRSGEPLWQTPIPDNWMRRMMDAFDRDFYSKTALLGIDHAKPGGDKTFSWRLYSDGQHRQTATQVHRCTAQSYKEDPGDAWRRLSQAFDTGQIYTQSQAYAAVAVSWKDAEPPIPREDPRVGEIIGWRAWRVGRSQHCNTPYLVSLARDTRWLFSQPMTGEPSDDGRDGVNAFKTRRLCFETAGITSAIRGGGTLVIGQVALWGDVVEHEHGYRAQFGAVHSLDFMTGIGDAEGDELLAELRRRYISP